MKNTTDPDGHDVMPLSPDQDLEKTGLEIVEKGVRKLVGVLNKLGYKTACSCAGHVGGLEPYPWIVILMKESKSPLADLAESVGKFNFTRGENGHMPRASDTWILCPIVGHADFTIYLQPCENNRGNSRKTISRLRKQADELATFLEKYFDVTESF